MAFSFSTLNYKQKGLAAEIAYLFVIGILSPFAEGSANLVHAYYILLSLLRADQFVATTNDYFVLSLVPAFYNCKKALSVIYTPVAGLFSVIRIKRKIWNISRALYAFCTGRI